jgi:hypothetical protein
MCEALWTFHRVASGATRFDGTGLHRASDDIDPSADFPADALRRVDRGISGRWSSRTPEGEQALSFGSRRSHVRSRGLTDVSAGPPQAVEIETRPPARALAAIPGRLRRSPECAVAIIGSCTLGGGFV